MRQKDANGPGGCQVLLTAEPCDCCLYAKAVQGICALHFTHGQGTGGAVQCIHLTGESAGLFQLTPELFYGEGQFSPLQYFKELKAAAQQRLGPRQGSVTCTAKNDCAPWQWPASQMFTNSSVLFHAKKLVFPVTLCWAFNVYG